MGDIEVGPDYEPDNGSELVYDSAGNPITQAYLDEVAAEFESLDGVPDDARVEVRVAGRPSLSGSGRVSPAVHFRVSDLLRAKAEERARRDGKTVSELAREALEHYLAS